MIKSSTIFQQAIAIISKLLITKLLNLSTPFLLHKYMKICSLFPFCYETSSVWLEYWSDGQKGKSKSGVCPDIR